jgi:hypothetical protein
MPRLHLPTNLPDISCGVARFEFTTPLRPSGMKDGQAVNVRATIEVNFRLLLRESLAPGDVTQPLSSPTVAVVLLVFFQAPPSLRGFPFSLSAT